ncbi:cyclic pyranopterin monophosphate synthase MoaC [Aquirufa rosea]|uniref:cyclic pyranopterin monophosphate synthase n=1 Tax=Aquirufa rosea TaxID=2509241 RepID=A0A4Q1C0N1_9BACT|nr:cyclic pyranopterin monophosphate synthase MoaC [Aquirufa rosea]RXK49907.1 cyclic pyranopterin monophosphate synthase MoaC [Aquirufa rosea]
MAIEFSHLDAQNQPGMVDVGAKNTTLREAKAQSIIYLGADIVQHFEAAGWQNKKGSILQTAIIAGTMAAKKTGDLIPLCHPLGLDACTFDMDVQAEEIIITCTCRLQAKTGVEMEALIGASVAALTIYDMCKSVSKGLVIKETKLLSKSGGKSDFQA